MARRHRKTALSNSDYQNELEQIIQRNYFPDTASGRASASHVTSPTLTTFHAATISRDTAAWDKQQRRDALQRQNHQVAIYVRPQLMQAYDSDDAEERPRRELARCELRNALFCPHSTTDSALSTTSRENDRHELAIDSMPRISHPTPVPERSIEPAATRFPRPAIPQPNDHWEEDSSDDDGHTSCDASTDLDSTVVASIRAEIRQGAVRQRQLRARVNHQSTHTAAAQAESSDSLPGYQIPSVPAVILRSQSKRASNAMLPPRNVVKTKPRRHKPSAKRDALSTTVAKAPSARSSGAFAFSLRLAYSGLPAPAKRPASKRQKSTQK